MAEALTANIKRVGMPQWSEADQRLANAAQRELKAPVTGLRQNVSELPSAGSGEKMYGSDDIAEVAWNIPTVVLRFPGNIPGMVGHHWSSGIAMATPIAHKGTTAGAAAHAMTALDLLLDPALLKSAREYFAIQTHDIKWQSLIPVSSPAPIELNKDKMERFRPQLDKLRYDPSKYKRYLDQLGVEYPTLNY